MFLLMMDVIESETFKYFTVLNTALLFLIKGDMEFAFLFLCRIPEK